MFSGAIDFFFVVLSPLFPLFLCLQWLKGLILLIIVVSRLYSRRANWLVINFCFIKKLLKSDFIYFQAFHPIVLELQVKWRKKNNSWTDLMATFIGLRCSGSKLKSETAFREPTRLSIIVSYFYSCSIR